MLEQLSPSQRMHPPPADLRHSTLPTPVTGQVTLSDPSLDACCLTQRVERLRTAYFRACPEVCIERPQLVTRFHQELGLFNQKRIGILDKARVYRRVLETRAPIIWHTEANDKNGQRFIVLISPSAFMGTGAATSAADYLALGPLPYLGLLAGALSPALAGILVIALASGRVGLRDLRSRMFRWRVGVRWYAVALLTVPLLWTTILGAFSLASQAFLPGIITAEDKASLLVAGLVLGLVASFFEEIGWTGFATAELSKRHGVLATGLIVGLPWCVLHVPLYAATASGPIPPALYVPVMAFSILLPYRVLMVWVYDRTQSALMAMLMHLTLIVWPFVLPGSPAMVGVPDLIFNLVFGATLWVFVAAVADRRKLSRGEDTRATPGLATRRRSA